MAGRAGERSGWSAGKGPRRLVAASCDACGESLIFVARGHRRKTGVRCPECSLARTEEEDALPASDCQTLATEVLIVAYELQRAADDDDPPDRSLEEWCLLAAAKLQRISTTLLPPAR